MAWQDTNHMGCTFGMMALNGVGWSGIYPIGIELWDKILYQPHGRVLEKGFGMIPEPMVLFQYTNWYGTLG